MQNQYKKIFWGGIFAFLSLAFCLPVLAVQLEIDYPVIDGQTLTSTSTLPEFAIYTFKALTFLGFLSVFISIVMAGIMYLLSPANPSADLLSRARDRLSGAMSGLLILATLYLIVTTINPQLAFFNFNKLPPPPPPPEETKQAGVYFHKSEECKDEKPVIQTSSVYNLGNDLTNQVGSVSIQKDSTTGVYYVSVVYEQIGFSGKCQYISPNKPCTNLTKKFTASASVYQYDFDPNGDGVYFYRKSYFDEKGGYLKVGNSEIKGIYLKRLEELEFKNVPEEEQDCTKYDKNGECVKGARKTPTLAGENISSIKIKGNYFVLLIYFGPGDKADGIWSSCQGFPTADDASKNGPQQIKWQPIRNSNWVLPNYVAIIPISQK